MNKFIELRRYRDDKLIYVRVNAIISVVDERPTHDWTNVYTFAGAPLEFHVTEYPHQIMAEIDKVNLQK